MSWKSYTHVTMLDRPYPPEKQAEGLAISQAIVGGHCETCGFLSQCSTQKDFRFPVFAWCAIWKGMAHALEWLQQPPEEG